MPVLDWIALAGTVAFAVSGALLAARHRLDLVAFVFMASLTGVGGGTVRDLLLGVPVGWVRDPTDLVLCGVAALATWAGARQFARIARGLLWADAVGIALFAVLGAQKALDHGAAPLVAVVMGCSRPASAASCAT